jgi:hypothetical protein
LVTSFIYVPHIVGSVFGPIRFLLPVCRFCWFLYTFNIHLYMHNYRCIFISNYWWQKSDVWSQASYRYPILWEVFFDPSDSCFLFAEERGYHRWALVHSSSCLLSETLQFWWGFFSLNLLNWELLVVSQQIPSISKGLWDKLSKSQMPKFELFYFSSNFNAFFFTKWSSLWVIE